VPRRPAPPTDLPGPDLRLVVPASAAWLGCLYGLAHSASAAVTALAVLVVGGAVFVLLGSVRARRRLRSASAVRLVVLSACVGAAGTVLAAGLRIGALADGPVVRLAHQGATGEADLVVTADPRLVRSRVVGNTRAPTEYAVPADLVWLRTGADEVRQRLPVLVVGAGPAWSTLLPGQPVRVTARLEPADPSGGDDVAVVLSARGPPTLTGSPALLQRVAGQVRAGLRGSVASLSPPERGLVAGLVDGDTSQLPTQTADDFRAAGLTHLVAVSGSNVAFVLAAVLVAARWAGLRGYAVPTAGALGLCAFTVLARPEPSVVRAALMGLLVLASSQRGTQSRTGPATLCAAVVVLLAVDPFLARSAGFALSVLATGGLLVLAPGWRERLSHRWPRPVADAVATAFAAQVATVPVLVLLTPNLSLLSVPANVLAEPAVPAATVLGALVAVVGVALPPAGSALAHLAAVPAWWIVSVAHVTAQLPVSSVGWPQGLVGVVLVVLAMCGARLAAPALLRRPATCAAVTAGVLVVAWVGVPPLPWQGWPPPGWLMVACDVGQGDGLVVSTGPGTAIVVDAGPDPVPVDRCLRDLRVTTVQLVVLTHFHADHVEGLPGVLRRRHVGEIEVTVLGDPPDEVRRVRAWAADAHVPVRQVRLGEERSVAGVSWTVLWPARVIDEDSRPNNASIVLRVVTQGVVLLLTGDVEPPAQSAILATDGGRLRADVVKVPHHGSANQDPEFLRATGARLALVSVGAGNPYGHPAPRTLDLLRSWGVQVERTDLDGDVAVVGSPGRVALVPRHPP
jgi:competence protein ComEC